MAAAALIPLRSRVPLGDAVVALGLVALAEADTFLSGHQAPRGVVSLVALAMTGPLAWRRRAPLAVLAASLAAMMTLGFVDGTASELYVLLATLLATYSVGANAARRPALLGLAAALALMLVGLRLDPNRHESGDYLFVVVLYAGGWGLGAALRDRSHRARRLESHAELLDREREREAREAVLEERARIARELHDVVAHSVSVMVVQNGVVRRADRAPSGPRRPSCPRGGRADRRRHSPRCGGCSDCSAPRTRSRTLAPQPGMAAVAHTRRAGARGGASGRARARGRGAAARRGPRSRRLPDRAGSAHERAQARGRGGHPRSRPLRAAPRLELSIDDQGPGAATGDGNGHGLARHARAGGALRGTLEAGPRAGGGFARARRAAAGARVIRVASLADDQAMVRRGFRLLLDGEDDMQVVAEAGNGEEAVAVVARHAPDVALMDVRMPVLDGLEATRRIVAADVPTGSWS